MMTEATLIDDGLWQGAYPERVPEGVHAVVNLVNGDDPKFRFPLGSAVFFLFAPIVDGPFRGLRWLDATVDMILGLRQAGYVVLVCCAAGISRSSLVVAACLMKARGLSAEKALDWMGERRPKINPNRYFREGLKEYEGVLRGKSKQ